MAAARWAARRRQQRCFNTAAETVAQWRSRLRWRQQLQRGGHHGRSLAAAAALLQRGGGGGTTTAARWRQCNGSSTAVAKAWRQRGGSMAAAAALPQHSGRGGSASTAVAAVTAAWWQRRRRRQPNHPCHGAANSANNCSRTVWQRSSVPLWTEGWRRITWGIVILECGRHGVVVFFVVFYGYLLCFRCYGT